MGRPELSERAESFLKLSSRAELAAWLGVSDKGLRYLLYRLPASSRYVSFDVPKRSGGLRRISAPSPFLKRVQSKVATVLPEISPPRGIAKGYVSGRGIVDNAKEHRRKRWVVAFDLQNFFPSINFGRIRGMFLAPPFCFGEQLSTVLAQICCCEGEAPQGAPTSPYISNILCRKLDRALLDFAVRNKVSVTRYADDICLSFNCKDLPSSVVSLDGGKYVLSEELQALVKEQGFSINHSKTRVMHRSGRQLVTGLVVNSKGAMPREWRRRVRTVAWLLEKYGSEKAGEIVSSWSEMRGQEIVPADSRLRGMTAFAAGLDKALGTKHMAALRRSYPVAATSIFYHPELRKIDVFTEGKTDREFLEFAFRQLKATQNFQDLRLVFGKISSIDGDGALYKNLERLVSSGVPVLSVGLFDFDSEQTISKLRLETGEFRLISQASQHVYAAVLPKPETLDGSVSRFCIEHYFPRGFVQRVTEDGRRLYFSDEFDGRTGFHRDLPVFRQNSAKTTLIVDDNVFDRASGENVALSKAEFARRVVNGLDPYGDADPMWFAPIFDMLKRLAMS